jgi:hypothetical protein
MGHFAAIEAQQAQAAIIVGIGNQPIPIGRKFLEGALVLGHFTTIEAIKT